MRFSIKQKMGKGLAKEIAKRISKEEFLEYLEEWWPQAFADRKGSLSLEEEVATMKRRLKQSGFWSVFETVGLTEVELEQSARNAAEKHNVKFRAPDEERSSAMNETFGRTFGGVTQEMLKTGRNDPCFCGSGKKYKKCCADCI